MARVFKTSVTLESTSSHTGSATFSGGITFSGANSPITLPTGGNGSVGQVLTSSGTGTTPTWTTPSSGSGTVTSASVVSANGFAGTVATSTTTPAITLSTTITGVLKGNGTAISAATAGTDYMSPTGGTFTGAVTASGGFTSSSTSTLNSITYFGASAATHIVQELVTTVGTGFAGYTWNIGGSSNIVYITANATANGTLALTWTGPSINTAIAIGQSWTGTILITNGATPYRITAMTVDGTAQTIKWAQGVAPSAGNANSIDAYTFVLIKTASSTYTVLGTFAKFA